jgi:hypothetical protein
MDCEHNGKSLGAEAQANLRVTAASILFRELTMENQTVTAGNNFCAVCGAPLPANAAFCGACGQHVQPLGTQAVPAAPTPAAPQNIPAQPAGAPGFNPQGLKCPRCGSTQVQAAKRGWKWTTGMIGSNKMVATCLQCGNTFDLA